MKYFLCIDCGLSKKTVVAGGSKDAFINTPKLLASGFISHLEGEFTRFLLNK